MKLKHFMLALVAMLSSFGFTANAANNVAKVGNTEYATIDEAIANWTSGTTLTLLANVTLSDVVKLKSNEHHYLNLSTYTMTAYNGKNAIEIVAYGNGGEEKGALTITADGANPGGINANSKSCIYYNYSEGETSGDDRPIIYIKGGVFTGSTTTVIDQNIFGKEIVEGQSGIFTRGKGSRKAATLNISGGTFNCTVYGAVKSKLIVSGGVFNYSVGSKGDSTANRTISGGKFKGGFSFMTSGDGKLTFGNVGVYVDKAGYLCFGGDPITELSSKYQAVNKNLEIKDYSFIDGLSRVYYLEYTTAKANGLYYEDASKAPAGSEIWTKPAVTIPEDVEGDATVVEEIRNNTALKDYTPENLPAGAELEIELKSVGEAIVYDVTPMADGAEVEPTEYITFRLPVPASVTTTHAKVLHEGASMGIYEIKGEGNAKYVEVSSKDFSLYTVEPTTPVAKIGDNYYATFAEALAAATGDVTVEIYEKVTLNGALTGSYSSIKFVGKDTDAEIYLDIQGYSEAAGKNVTFEDLKLSKVAGGYVTNAGFMNLAFGIYGATETTYTNCTFLNGAYASTGVVTFTGCTFKPSHDRYAFWAYGDANIIIDGCTFEAARGIKMYDEAQSGLAAVTVKGSNFSALTDKPAIVLTYGKSVELEGNIYSSTGVFELDLDGNPNGTLVTSNDELTCVNDNGVCGVLVDGKIYTTVAQAKEVATSGSNVILLHNSAETVEFAQGVNLDKNGFAAEGVTIEQPLASYVVLPEGMNQSNYKSLFGTNTVTDGTNYYATLQAAVEAVVGQANKVLYCKPGADVGSLQHAPVTNTLTVYGNGANVTSGSERDFDLGNTDPSQGKDITADMTLTVKYLNGCGAWGSKATEHTVNLVFENCANMGKVFISGTTGTLNITMTDCAFEGVIKEAVYSNADGAITLNNVAFSNLNKAVNLNHKAAGTQTVTINGCSFTNCGADVAADQIPVRVLSSVEGGKSVLAVSNTTFSGTPNGGADILLDYGVGTTEATVAGTAANVLPENKAGNAEMVAVALGDNYTYTNVLPVAKVGDVEYADLQEAINAAQNGEAIILIADVELTAQVVIPEGKELTLDLNGKTVTVVYQEGSTTKHIYALDNYGTLTITDSKGNGSINSRGIFVQDGSKLTVESGSLYGIDSNGGSALYQYGGDIVINGGLVEQKAEGTYNFAINALGGTVTVNGGKIAGNHGAIAAGGATVVINDGELVCTGTAGMTDNVLYTYGTGEITINGGTFVADNDGPAGGCCVYDANGKATINGGTFSNSSGGDVWGTTGTTIKGGTFENLTEKQHIAAGYELKDGTVVEKKVAEINGVEYATLAAAVAAVQEGETITLIDNVVLAERVTIPADKTLTIDLNGKSISMEESIIATAYAINNLGNLTITDGVGGGSINARGVYNGYGDGGANVATAKITVVNGTINAKGTNGGGAAIFNYGVADIQGGTFTSVASYAIALQTGSTMTIGENAIITGGINSWQSTMTITGGTISNDKSGKHVVYAGESAVTINGGTFHNNNSGNATIMASGSTAAVEITGGTFTLNIVDASSSYLIDATSSATYTISGGSFTGGIRAQGGTKYEITGGTFTNEYGNYNVYEGGDINISGGTFTGSYAQKFATDNLAAGYELGEDGTVVQVNYVAKIGETYYASLEAAVESAQAGDEIVVIAEVADVVVDVTKNLTISGSVTLNNVGINADGADALTVKGLTFTGNSWINSGTAEALTVSGVTATVAPSNASYTNSRSAFISLGRSEQQTLALTVENCNITVTSSGPDAILGWAAITKATITNNVIKGSNNGYFTNADAIKFMAIANGAKFEITGNEIWSNYNGIVFAQNTTRDNAYSVYADENKFVGGADHIWIEITGGNTVHATVNATSANTVNGSAFTINNIKYHDGVIKTWSSYAGVDVVTDENGKVIGGTLALCSNTECIADGYEMNTDDGTVGKKVVAKVNGVEYATLSAAFAAVTDDNQTVVICKDVTENLTGAYLRGNITTENGAKVTITLTNSDWVYCPYTFVVGENITLNVPALFYYAGGTVINGTVVADAYYQRYAGTKLTINEPGSLTVETEQFYLRYMDGDPNAGIYINGDNDPSTIGLNLAVAYFYQGMINAKDANIEAGTYWQTNETDGQGSANLVLDNSTLTVTVYDHPAKATGNSTVTLKNGSVLDAKNGGFTYDEANAALSVDKTSKIIGKNGETVMIPVAKIGATKYATLEDAFKAATEGCTIEILSDVTVSDAWDCRYTGSKFTVPVTINGNNHTIKFTGAIDDKNWNTVFRFEADATVNNLTVDISEATSVQRVISAKKSLAVDGLTIIGAAKYGVIFGEGASAEDLAAAEIVVKNSTLTGTRRAVSDNEGGKDVKSVTIVDNAFNANVYVSAKENITFTGNTVEGAYVDLRSYTANNLLNVTATGNTLTENGNVESQMNKINAGGTINAQNEFVVPAKGSVTPAFAGATSIWGEGGGNAKQSLVVKLYSGETLLATASLNNIGGIIDGDVYVSWNIPLNAAGNDEYWSVVWSNNVTAETMPTKVVMVIDGVEVAENNFQLNSPDDLNKIYAAVAAADGKFTQFCTTLAAAVNAAQASETVVILKDVEVASGSTITLDGVNVATLDGVTLTNNGAFQVKGEVSLNIATLAGSESIDFLDGATIKNSTIGGNVFVAGNVTFRGANTFAMLYDYGTLTDYYGTTAPMKWTVEEGASVTLTTAARYGLGYGDDVTVYGNIENALTARETLTDADRSLFMHGLVAQESKGWNCDSKFTVEDAYVAIGSNNSFGNKSGNYGGTYTFNIKNSVVDASRITFYEALSTTTFTIEGSDVKMGTFMTRDADSKFVLKNSKVLSTTTLNGTDEGNYNKGELTLENSSLTYSAEFKHEAGEINLDLNSLLTAPELSGAGKINVDATGIEGTVTVIKANMTGFTGTINVEGGNFEITSEGLVIKEKTLAGAGTEENPYLISNVEELVFFRDKVNSGDTKYNAPGVWVALAAEIDLAGTTWTEGIGDGHEWSFDGNFDGQGHTIKNLNIQPYADASGYVCGGLFGYIYGGATIKNLTIENATVEFAGEEGKEYFNVGVLVGFANNNGGKANISDITVKGDVKVDAPNVYGVGAIVGYSYRNMGTIENCTVEANAGSYIKGHSFVGGITGYSYTGAAIAECSVKNIAITATKYSVGGIAGLVLANNTISECVVENVTVNGEANVGNIVGALAADALVVENCTAAEGTIVGGRYTDNKAVEAKIDNVYYATLTAALATEGETTVELLVPYVVAADETVTLDLNGKTVTGVDNATGSYAMITNKGNLTIEGEGAITLIATNNRGWNAYSSVISNTVGGKLTINGGTIKHLGGTDMAYGIDNLTNGKGTYAETVINDGTVKSTYRAIRQFLNGVEAQNILTVNGGTIEGANKAIWMQDPSANANTGTLTVAEEATLNGDVYLSVTAGSTEWPVEVAIADAAFAEGKTVVTGNVPANYEVVLYEGVHCVEYNIIDELHIVDDRQIDEFVNRSNKTVGTLTYERTIANVDVWQPFYVPFEVSVSDLLAAGYEVAYFNDFRETIVDEEVVGDPVVELIKIKGGTLKANNPYVIKAKNTAALEMNLTLHDVKLYSTAASERNVVECSSATKRFEFFGNYKKSKKAELTGDGDCYVMTTLGALGTLSNTGSLGAFRVYMTITRKPNSPYHESVTSYNAIALRVIGEEAEDGTTIIYDVEMDDEQNVDYIYDLQGRRVLEPQKGELYIINGKKVIF